VRTGKGDGLLRQLHHRQSATAEPVRLPARPVRSAAPATARPTCAAGFNSCNGVDGGIGTCANFLTDSVNCGACGKVCDPGQSCTGGTCAETCAAGFSACGGGDGGAPYCANELIDNANCGGCNSPCPAGQVCNGSGTCAESCSTGFSTCPTGVTGPYCAKLTNDSNNCGTCGKVCSPGASCAASACSESCAAGYRVCGGGDGGAAYCANAGTDSNNCGTCGNICASGKSCSGGKCTESCATGYSACSNSYCADLTSDANNCGVCGTTCSSTFKAPGCCKSACTDLATGDPNNCGTCGTVCTGGAPGCCEAGCVDESNDLKNCGGCGTTCNGVEPACCSSGCVDEASDVNDCGGCGTVCKKGTTPACCLSAGSGACTDESTDANNCGGLRHGLLLGRLPRRQLLLRGLRHRYDHQLPGRLRHHRRLLPPDLQHRLRLRPHRHLRDDLRQHLGLRAEFGLQLLEPSRRLLLSCGGQWATVYVDGKLGADTNCCDTAATACQTITFAMKQIAAAGATGVTISAAWDASPKTRADWAPSNGETYPIHLGYGVTLKAAGIFFTPAVPKAGNSGVDVFDVYAYNAKDTGTVTIEGTSVDYALIGFNSTQTNLTGTTIAVNTGVANETAVPLTLEKVWLNGQTEALNVGPGATVSLGPSPVLIGSGANTANPLTSVKSPGSGIYCKGAAGSLATLLDVDAGGSMVLDVDQQDTGHPSPSTIAAIFAYDYCNITLSQSPVIGVPSPCPSPKVDGEGIVDQGGSTVSLTGATIQCLYNHGMDVGETSVAGLSGTPTLALASTLIQYTGQTALKINGGAVSPVTNSTIYHARLGVILQEAGTLDLSGGGNMAVCTTSKEPGYYNNNGGTAPGINVWNQTAATSIDASNMLWDNNPPGYWTCTDPANATTANTCTCASGTCNGMNIEAPDDSDAVTADNTNATPIVLTNPSLQTTYTCN
jgi:hypothetical protein